MQNMDEVGAVKKTWEGDKEDKPMISLSGDIHTSQQTRGEHHLAEGKGDGPKDSVWGTEDAPNGIATSTALKDDTRTSQQILGQFSLAGEDHVKIK